MAVGELGPLPLARSRSQGALAAALIGIAFPALRLSGSARRQPIGGVCSVCSTVTFPTRDCEKIADRVLRQSRGWSTATPPRQLTISKSCQPASDLRSALRSWQQWRKLSSNSSSLRRRRLPSHQPLPRRKSPM